MMLGLFLLPLIGAVVVTVLGAVWFGPIFGKQYRMIMGVTPEMMAMDPMGNKKSMIINMIIELVMNFIMFFGFFIIMDMASAGTYSAALIFGLLFWLFIIMPNKVSGIIWGGKSRKNSWALFGIGASYSLISFLLVAALFVALVPLFLK